MAPKSRESEEIQAGIYLEDLPPRPLDEHRASSVKNFSRPFDVRPYIVPVFDPEHSNIDMPDIKVPPRVRHAQSFSSIYATPSVGGYEASSHCESHHGHHTRDNRGSIEDEATRRAALLAWQATRPRSFVSFTPAQLPDISSAQPLSHGQIKELDRINRHEKQEEADTPLLFRRHEIVVEEPPDGGRLAWAHAVCGFIVTMNTQGFNMAFGIFQSYYEKTLLTEDTHSKIAWIGSFQIFATFFMSILTAPLVSKGYFRLCFGGGTLLVFSCLILVSLCSQWWQIFLIQGVFMGMGMGLVFHSGIVLLTTYFSTRLGTATAICAAGSSIGGIVFPLVASHTLPALGYGWTMRIIAFFNAITMIPVNMVVRQRSERPSPTKYALDWTAFRDFPFMLMATGMFFAFWGVYFGFYFIVAFAEDVLKMTATNSVNLLIAMNACNLAGRFIPNLISDACIGPMNTLIPASVLASMFVFIWIGVTTQSSLYLVACFYGFAAAGIQSLYISTIFSFSGTDRKKISVRMALVFVLISVGSLTGAPLGGQLVVLKNGNYLYAQLFSGITIAIGSFFFLLARLAKQGCAASRV